MRTFFLILVVVLAGCVNAPLPAQSPALPIPTAPELPLLLESVEVPEPAEIVPAAEASVPEPEAWEGLCESLDAKRPFPTPAERKQVKRLIRDTCKAMGVSVKSCVYFERIVSLRESSYRPWVRTRLAGDRSAALRAYVRSTKYGWEVSWSRKARKQENLSEIHLTPIEGQEQNEHFKDAARWWDGLGLGSVNPANHLWRIGSTEPPEVLCDPVLNVMVQVWIARSAVRKYRAKDVVEVQAIYGGRTTYDSEGRRVAAHIPEKDRAIRKRCLAKGLDCAAPLQLGTKLDFREMTTEEIYEAAAAVRGTAVLGLPSLVVD